MNELMTKWSWSALMCYRTCKLWARFKYVLRLPEPPEDTTKEQPNVRGSRLHQNGEDFVLRGTALPPEFMPFEGPITDIREMYLAGGHVTVENREYYDHNWQPCEKDDQWLVVVKDVKVKIPGDFSLTVDYKTGKKFGNEIKHYGQCELYAITDMITDDSYSFYDAELWYIDQKDIWPIQFAAPKLMRQQKVLDDEVQKMLNDRLFRPTPSKVTCKYCPYSPKGTGDCPVGVT